MVRPTCVLKKTKNRKQRILLPFINVSNTTTPRNTKKKTLNTYQAICLVFFIKAIPPTQHYYQYI